MGSSEDGCISYDGIPDDPIGYVRISSSEEREKEILWLRPEGNRPKAGLIFDQTGRFPQDSRIDSRWIEDSFGAIRDRGNLTHFKKSFLTNPMGKFSEDSPLGSQGFFKIAPVLLRDKASHTSSTALHLMIAS